VGDQVGDRAFVCRPPKHGEAAMSKTAGTRALDEEVPATPLAAEQTREGQAKWK
jgi:hypothetical protein